MKTLSSVSQALLSVTLLSFGSLLGGCAAATEEDLADESGSTSDAIKSDGIASGSANAGTGKAVPPIAPVDPVPPCPPPTQACTPKECGPVPAMATVQCDDGSTPPAPVCGPQANTGKCGWSFGTCPAPVGTSLSGTWGGDHINLNAVALKGGASNVHLEFDCASADFSIGPIDKTGTFKAYGAYFQGQGGPVKDGQTIPAVKALFEGSLSTAQDQMKLTVTLLDGRSIGFFFLVKGKNAIITQCL